MSGAGVDEAGDGPNPRVLRGRPDDGALAEKENDERARLSSDPIARAAALKRRRHPGADESPDDALLPDGFLLSQLDDEGRANVTWKSASPPRFRQHAASNAAGTHAGGAMVNQLLRMGRGNAAAVQQAKARSERRRMCEQLDAWVDAPSASGSGAAAAAAMEASETRTEPSRATRAPTSRRWLRRTSRRRRSSRTSAPCRGRMAPTRTRRRRARRPAATRPGTSREPRDRSVESPSAPSVDPLRVRRRPRPPRPRVSGRRPRRRRLRRRRNAPISPPRIRRRSSAIGGTPTTDSTSRRRRLPRRRRRVRDDPRWPGRSRTRSAPIRFTAGRRRRRRPAAAKAAERDARIEAEGAALDAWRVVSATRRDDGILELVARTCGDDPRRRVLRLHDMWAETRAFPGDLVRLATPRGRPATNPEDPTAPVDVRCDGDTLVVMHPGTMVNSTAVGSSMQCLRRTVLQTVVPDGADGDFAQAAMLGTLSHELSEASLFAAAFGTGPGAKGFFKHAAELAESSSERLFGAGVTEREAIDRLRYVGPGVHKWGRVGSSSRARRGRRRRAPRINPRGWSATCWTAPGGDRAGR